MMNTVGKQQQFNMTEPAESLAARALFDMHSSPITMPSSPLPRQQQVIPSLSLSAPSTPKSIPMNGHGHMFARSLCSNGFNDLSLSPNPQAAAGALCAIMSNKVERGGSRNRSGFLASSLDRNDMMKVEHNRARTLSLMSLDTEYDVQMNDASMSTTSSSLPESSFLDLYRSGVNGSATSNNGQRMIGSYTLASRRKLLDRFLEKRKNRTWKKRIKYDVRKNFADSRLRVKGRFVKKEDEEQLREVLLMTA